MKWPERRLLITGTFLAPSTRASSGCVAQAPKVWSSDASMESGNLKRFREIGEEQKELYLYEEI
jgi:hypothetical protein